MANDKEKLNQMLYNLLSECTFVAFNVGTIIQQIESRDYQVSQSDLDRFFVCNTSCDMMSFAGVYILTIKYLYEKNVDASIKFASMVLNDALKIWKRGTHYRMVLDYLDNEEYELKSVAIDSYLKALIIYIKKIYEKVPLELQDLYNEVEEKVKTA